MAIVHSSDPLPDKTTHARGKSGDSHTEKRPVDLATALPSLNSSPPTNAPLLSVKSVGAATQKQRQYNSCGKQAYITTPVAAISSSSPFPNKCTRQIN